MCGSKAPKPPPPPAPPPPAPPPPTEVEEVGSRRDRENRDLNRETRSETRRVDRASASITSDGAGLRL